MNLKGKPFYLDDKKIEWVENTLSMMTLDEKIGQIFVDILWNDSEKDIKKNIEKYHEGGFRYNNRSAEKLYKQNSAIQKYSKIPALIAANVEAGGDGAIKGGTKIGDPVAIGATQNKEYAYDLGYIGCKEAAAVGCNWTFAPIVDINYNWRNVVVSNRCFGSDPDMVLEMSKEYMRGAHDAGVACCMKHFPGDGLDERDQHIVTTINTMSCEEWDSTYGKVYEGMIEAGVPSIMIGHIQLPSYTKRFCQDIKDNEIMPATLAKELLNELLREQLKFNGLIITDATHMVGLTSTKPRREFIPSVIECGCDMILYYRDKDEDIKYFKDGLKNGLVSEKRLNEAVKRVLAFKAMLNLPQKKEKQELMLPKENLKIIGCPEHKEKAAQIIDNSITLVKNTKNQLPIVPSKHKRIVVFSINSSKGLVSKVIGNSSKAEKILVEELNKAGFEASIFKINPLKYISNKGINGKKVLSGLPVEEFISRYDAAFLIANVDGFSQSNERRLHWMMPMGPDIPWYVTELPTVFISVKNPFHLIDVPMVPTYINTYNKDREAIRQTIEKIMGKSDFKGISSVDAFCDSWDTKL